MSSHKACCQVSHGMIVEVEGSIANPQLVFGSSTRFERCIVRYYALKLLNSPRGRSRKVKEFHVGDGEKCSIKGQEYTFPSSFVLFLAPLNELTRNSGQVATGPVARGSSSFDKVEVRGQVVSVNFQRLSKGLRRAYKVVGI